MASSLVAGVVNFGEPEYVVRWPTDLLVDELNVVWTIHQDPGQLERVLTEAFVGPSIRDDLAAVQNSSYDLLDMGSKHTTDAFVEEIAAAAEDGLLRYAANRPPRWRERNTGQRLEPELLSGPAVRQRFKNLLVDLDERGYFDEHAPTECVDDRYFNDRHLAEVVNDEAGIRLRFEFLRRRYNPLDGFDQTLEALSHDEFYELIETFHDLASRPRSSYFHDFGGCGDHFRDFAPAVGRRLYRWLVNRILDQSEIPLRLAEDGEFVGRLMGTTDDGRTDLVEHVIIQAAEPAEESQLAHAIGLFRLRGATEHDKRSAIVSLAGLLEERRDLLKEHLLSNDEGALFQIANKFGIRHQTASQSTDYDPMFLDWVFWWYLGTIELTQRLLSRQEGEHG